MLAFLKFLCWFLFIYYLVKVLVRILAPILLRNITIKMQDRFKDQFHKQYTRSEDTVQEEGKITIEDLQGGTFTITNGGIYGSMLSTPILNPPQSAVLGMHNIIERAIVEDGEIKVRPMMYLALSYDHRIIDGKEAVSFLKIVKDSLEQPKRLFLNL